MDGGWGGRCCLDCEVVCEIQNNARQNEDSEPASLRTIWQEAETGGILDLRLHGHEVRRPAGAAHTGGDDCFEVTEEAGAESKRWAWKPKDVQTGQVTASNVASLFKAHAHTQCTSCSAESLLACMTQSRQSKCQL